MRVRLIAINENKLMKIIEMDFTDPKKVRHEFTIKDFSSVSHRDRVLA